MLKAFLRDSAVYGLANALTRVVQIVLVPVYTRVLTPFDLGVIDMMVTVLTALLRPVVTLEITQGMARYYAEVKEPGDRVRYASTTLWFSVAAALVLLAVGLPLGGVLAPFVLGHGTGVAFRLGLVTISAYILFYTVTNQLVWALRPVAHGVASVAFAAVTAAAAVIWVVGLDAGVAGVFYAQLSGYAVSCALAFYASRRDYALVFDRARCREMLSYSSPLVLSVIGAYVAMLADRVAIRALMGLDDVGVYGIGARVASTATLLLFGFKTALTPLIYNNYKDPDTAPALARTLRVFLATLLPILLGLAVYAHELVLVLATGRYAAAGPVIPLLGAALVLSGMVMFAPGVNLAKKSKLVAAINVATAFQNVALNIALIPLLGITGSALATLLSALTGFVWYMLASQRYYRIPYPWARILIAVAAASACAVAGMLLDAGGMGLAARLAAKSGLFLAGSVAAALILIRRDELVMIRDRVVGWFR